MATLRSNSGKLPVRLIILVLLLGLLGGGGFMGFKKIASRKHVKAAPVQVASTLVPLDEMVVNLADSQEAHYAKAKIVLEVQGDSAKTESDESMAKIRDAAISTISSKSFDDLLTAEGKAALKDAIKQAVSKDFKTSKVVSVYFSDFAMQ